MDYKTPIIINIASGLFLAHRLIGSILSERRKHSMPSEKLPHMLGLPEPRPEQWLGLFFLQRWYVWKMRNIYHGRFPAKQWSSPVTWFEKRWMLLLVSLDFCSVGSSLKWTVFYRRPGSPFEDNRRRGFIDAYVICKLTLLSVFLCWGCTHWAIITVAVYFILEMMGSTLTVLFVNSYDAKGQPSSPNRSVVLALMGYVTVILGFALFYKASQAVITDGPHPSVVLDSANMVYFSLVTITTVGYGELRPKAGSAAVWLASTEVAIGLIIVVILLTRFLALARPPKE